MRFQAPRFPILPFAVSALSLVLSGCATSVQTATLATSFSSTGAISSGFGGSVHGGQQAIVGARVYLYAVSTTTGGASVSLLNTPGFVITGLGGNFSITTDYTCPAGAYVYLLALGGNPGLPNVVNPAIALGSALGPCSALQPSSFATINEVTTVAMTSAFVNYATSETQIGINADLGHAFAAAALLADSVHGSANSPSSTVAVPQAAINTLANSISACINSSGSGAPCSTLFNAANVSSASGFPVDTFQAALNIAKNPTANTNTIYNLGTPNSIFAPTLPAAPATFNVTPINTTGCIAADANTYLMSTTRGNIVLELRPDVAPRNVANFLAYVNNGSYAGSFFHRSVPSFVIQGGGYTYSSGGQILVIPTFAPVISEPALSNLRGTLAMALTSAPNTATDEFFFNQQNNPSLDTQLGGFTVIGQFVDVAGVSSASGNAGYCLGSTVSLAVMDAIGADQIVNAGSPFDSLPVVNYTSGANIQGSNLEYVNSIVPYTNVATTPATPLFYPATNYYTTASSVTISDSTPGAVIYYSVQANGGAASAYALYTGPVSIPNMGVVAAYAVAPGYPNNSDTGVVYSGVSQTPPH